MNTILSVVLVAVIVQTIAGQGDYVGRQRGVVRRRGPTRIIGSRGGSYCPHGTVQGTAFGGGSSCFSDQDCRGSSTCYFSSGRYGYCCRELHFTSGGHGHAGVHTRPLSIRRPGYCQYDHDCRRDQYCYNGSCRDRTIHRPVRPIRRGSIRRAGFPTEY